MQLSVLFSRVGTNVNHSVKGDRGREKSGKGRRRKAGDGGRGGRGEKRKGARRKVGERVGRK